MEIESKQHKSYWFKARLYGWGWVPVKWQGWLDLYLFSVTGKEKNRAGNGDRLKIRNNAVLSSDGASPSDTCTPLSSQMLKSQGEGEPIN